MRRAEPELALETLSLLRRHTSTRGPAKSFRSEIALAAMDRLIKSPGFP